MTPAEIEARCKHWRLTAHLNPNCRCELCFTAHICKAHLDLLAAVREDIEAVDAYAEALKGLLAMPEGWERDLTRRNAKELCRLLNARRAKLRALAGIPADETRDEE